jgi:hypothetical protein
MLTRAMKMFAVVAVAVGLALGAYLVYLDRIVTQTFDGRRWSVPAVVYAQPLEVYVGADLSMSDISAELDRLGYQQRAELSVAGLYKRSGSRLEVHLRGFQFMERLRAIDSPHVKTIRGKGLWIGIVLKDTAGGARRFCEALKSEGLLCKETHETVIRIAPPLTISRDEIDWAVTRIEKVLTTL